ncbi:uncharacterized protein Bfra_005746 [Botrytis fragariae]|uniref:Uncharacterized protein n=1 Tax=Botrytis fragariae TaxID=1964551 RepID=A0A8H6EHF4_9HELO|nr:uncharacterized protein Bfra_005746 [Botrytis fragariae]KAF5872387.1 hypothetical protein Bfra_005746 [Botrytis fragariae]
MSRTPTPPPPEPAPDPKAVIDPRNKPTLTVVQNKYTTYDFTPFLSSPAVLHRMRENRHQIPLISPIPATRIPSPLAENLHPSVIKDVRDFLLGSGKYKSPYALNYSGDGHEVWKSWKRAWDIWNNHYMEGRVNEVWVARAYAEWEAYIKQQKKKGKLPFEGPAGRRQHRRKKVKIGKPYRTEAKALEQFETSISEIAQGRREWKERATENLKALFKQNRNLGDGYIEFCEALAEWQRRNWDAPKWEDFKNYKQWAPEYLPLTMEYVRDELPLSLQERVEELLGSEFWKKDPKPEAQPGSIEYAIALAKWEELPEVRRCKLTSRPNWNETYRPAESLEEKYIEFAMKRTSPAVVDEFKDRMEKNKRLGVGYIELSWQQAHYNITTQAYGGELDPTIMEKPDPQDYIDKARPGKPESDTPATAIDREPDDGDEEDDENFNPNDLTRPFPIEDDGSSGGFFAMKNFIEYAVPDEDDETFQEYYDPIENSVWRPRQVGEHHVKVDMDEEPDAFLKNSQFEIDGGVDCGRSPYPLLRPLCRYAQSKVKMPDDDQPNVPYMLKPKDHGSLLKIKKFWDKVTGTIFNIPIKNIYQQTLDKIEDRDHRESFENSNSYQNPDIFPLDIRRCEAIPTPINPGEERPKAVEPRGQDNIIEPSFKMKEKEYRPMRFDDPWWVAPEQKYYRDMPPRNYPPKCDETQSFLPKDVRLWNDEIDKDSDLKHRYFVANLDGRLLTINGIAVSKGEIAGPLPEFAIIQSEGGGVSFWHGVGGRFYLQPADASTKDWSRQWSSLRQTLRDEYFGVAAGYYWQNAIVGKIMEDDEGEGEQDLKWIRWKNAKPARNTNIPDPCAVKLMSHRGFLDYYAQSEENEDWGAPGPLPFESPEAELKWVAAQLHFQETFLAHSWLRSEMVEPTSDTAWGGLPPNYGDVSNGPTDDQRNQWWESHKDNAEKVQSQSSEIFHERFFDEIEEEQTAYEAKSLKRQADNDGYFPPDAKRFRQNIEEREKEKIAEIEKREGEKLEMGVQELVDEINKGVKEIEGPAPGSKPTKLDLWKPASDAEAEAQAREALRRVRELERLRVFFNEQRKDAHEIQIPPIKDPIAGLAPSTILTLPANRWALEAIVRHREEHRLDEEVQETSALNNQNASERLKRKRIAERRKRGALGFTPMTEADRKEQERRLIIKAKEEKDARDMKIYLKLADKYKSKEKQVRKDRQHAAAVKDGVQPGDVVKAEAASKKGEKELEEQQLEMAKQLSMLSWAQSNGLSLDDLIQKTSIPGFDPTDHNTWVHKASDSKRDKENLESANTAANVMGMTIDEWFKNIHGVADANAYLTKLNKHKGPYYVMSVDAKKAKDDFRRALLASVSGYDGTKEGDFASWDDVVSYMPVAPNWDEIQNSDHLQDPDQFGMVPRKQEVNPYDGKMKWVGEL